MKNKYNIWTMPAKKLHKGLKELKVDSKNIESLRNTNINYQPKASPIKFGKVNGFSKK